MILVAGEILVEIMADAPGVGFRAPIALTGPYPSGAPAIFAAQAARLGASVAMISAVGRDDFGAVTLDRLRADGVDMSAVSLGDRPTGTAFVRYRTDGGRDFVFNLRHAACGALRPGKAAARAVAAAQHLHVMGSSLPIPWVRRLVLTAAPQIKARGGTVSFDPNLRREVMDSPGMAEAMQAVLGMTDVFLPSGEELWLLTGTRAGDDAAALEPARAGCGSGGSQAGRCRGEGARRGHQRVLPRICRARSGPHRRGRLLWRGLCHRLARRSAPTRGPAPGLRGGRAGRDPARPDGGGALGGGVERVSGLMFDYVRFTEHRKLSRAVS